MIILPTVVQVGRIYFNCPTLDGVELENQGEAGSIGAHWDKRILLNEVREWIYSRQFTFRLWLQMM